MRSIMKKNTELIKKAAVTVLVMTLFLTTFAFGVTEDYSTENDPLVSLSYINGVLTPSLEKYVDDKVKSVSADEVESALMKNDSFKEYIASVIASQTHGGTSGSSASDSFITLELSAGKRVTANGRCEIIVRSGQAAAVSKTDGAVKDLSANKTLSSGDTVVPGNLIEISYSDGSGVAALRTPTEILVRGEFTIGE